MASKLVNYFSELSKSIFGFKVGDIRIIPVSTKIILVFITIMLVSNFSSNYINLFMHRAAMTKLAQQILVKDLTDLFNLSTTQYDLFQLNMAALNITNQNSQSNVDESEIKKFRDRAMINIEVSSMDNSTTTTGIALGLEENGTINFTGARTKIPKIFTDTESLNTIKKDKQGIILFNYNNLEYLGAYKYEEKWDLYIMRAEEVNTFYKDSNKTFKVISIIIFVFTSLSTFIGILILRYVLRYIGIFTRELVRMNKEQTITKLNLSNAPNDDITFLGLTFNVFSDTISNLIEIFKKFVSKDVAYRVYKEKEIKLEGSQQELTILFSDIRRFTFITEMLGNDIIKLLNLHYEFAIEQIVRNYGIIGSIIGDALLAVYGTMENIEDNNKDNKSLQAIKTAYSIQKTTLNLRKEMKKRKAQLLEENITLTEVEDKVFESVSIEVGVGIDGGRVFYGNIGSYEHMTNTVIGDNVNNASRLEGLTKLYQIPVICSEYVKNDVESNLENKEKEYIFLEIDTVQVFGKTSGKKIYWPIPMKSFSKIEKDFESYQKGLYFYYNGDWNKAKTHFAQSNLPPVLVFLDRMKNNIPSKEWNGIWKATEK